MTASDDKPRFSAAGLAERAIEPLLNAVRKEFRSAREEIRERIRSSRSGAVLLAIGVVTGIVTVGLLAATIVVLLLLVLPAWVAMLICLVLFAVVTGLL